MAIFLSPKAVKQFKDLLCACPYKDSKNDKILITTKSEAKKHNQKLNEYLKERLNIVGKEGTCAKVPESCGQNNVYLDPCVSEQLTEIGRLGYKEGTIHTKSKENSRSEQRRIMAFKYNNQYQLVDPETINTKAYPGLKKTANLLLLTFEEMTNLTKGKKIGDLTTQEAAISRLL